MVEEKKPTELEYIKLTFTDIVNRIAEAKQHQWEVIKWIVGMHAAMVAFGFSTLALNKMPVGYKLLPVFVGIVGCIYYYYLQGDLKSHRVRLDDLRKLMGGFVLDLEKEDRDANILEGVARRKGELLQVAVIFSSTVLSLWLLW